MTVTRMTIHKIVSSLDNRASRKKCEDTFRKMCWSVLRIRHHAHIHNSSGALNVPSWTCQLLQRLEIILLPVVCTRRGMTMTPRFLAPQSSAKVPEIESARSAWLYTCSRELILAHLWPRSDSSLSNNRRSGSAIRSRL